MKSNLYYSYRPGDRVHHTLFGRGVVKSTKSHPQAGESIVIAFDDDGTKELQLSFTHGKLVKVQK